MNFWSFSELLKIFLNLSNSAEKRTLSCFCSAKLQIRFVSHLLFFWLGHFVDFFLLLDSFIGIQIENEKKSLKFRAILSYLFYSFIFSPKFYTLKNVVCYR